MTLTLAQAYGRARWYTWLARLIVAAWVALLLFSALKTGTLATQNYAAWPHPFSRLGWEIQRVASSVYDFPGGAMLWDATAAIELPSWLVRTEVLVSLSFLFVGGVMRRAALELRKGLQDALQAAQLMHWQRELMGERPAPVPVSQIGIQVNLYQQLPAPQTPWWTRPWGLLLIAILGGVASAVVAQWLNIELGLVK